MSSSMPQSTWRGVRVYFSRVISALIPWLNRASGAACSTLSKSSIASFILIHMFS